MNALSAIVLVAVAAVASASVGPLGGPIDSAAVVAGPSGTIVRSGLSHVAAPLALAHAGHVVASPLALAHSAHLGLGARLIVPAGSGLEGQWVPDINEKLYDDGSYKPHIYGL